MRVLVDTTVESFSHGHTYVAVSRTTCRTAFRLWVGDVVLVGTKVPITNVVFKELIVQHNFNTVWRLPEEVEFVAREEGYASPTDEPL